MSGGIAAAWSGRDGSVSHRCRAWVLILAVASTACSDDPPESPPVCTNNGACDTACKDNGQLGGVCTITGCTCIPPLDAGLSDIDTDTQPICEPEPCKSECGNKGCQTGVCVVGGACSCFDCSAVKDASAGMDAGADLPPDKCESDPNYLKLGQTCGPCGEAYGCSEGAVQCCWQASGGNGALECGAAVQGRLKPGDPCPCNVGGYMCMGTETFCPDKCGPCSVKSIQCGDTLEVVVAAGFAAKVDAWGCSKANAPTTGPELGFDLNIPSGGKQAFIVRAYGAGLSTAGPVEQQTLHLLLMDAQASAQACAYTGKCEDFTAKQMLCTAGGKAGCKAEWRVEFEAGPGPRRLVLDTIGLAPGVSVEVTAYCAEGAGCKSADECADVPCADKKCAGGVCQYDKKAKQDCCVKDDDECDNGKSCDTDLCKDNKCVHVVVPGGCCDTADCAIDSDNDPCTNPSCEAGKCVQLPPTGGCCTAADCPDDADSCTTKSCKDGKCVQLPPDGGCCTAEDCADDEDVCTKKVCDNQLCKQIVPSGKECCDASDCADDQDPCTQALCTSQGKCEHKAGPGKECCAAADCSENDGDPCTVPACVGFKCVEQPPKGKCCADQDCKETDGNLCSIPACVNGKCLEVKPTGQGTCASADDCPSKDCNLKSCSSDCQCTYSQENVGGCSKDGDCDDGDDCTLNTCDGCSCKYPLKEPGGCSAKITCSTQQECMSSECVKCKCELEQIADGCTSSADCYNKLGAKACMNYPCAGCKCGTPSLKGGEGGCCQHGDCGKAEAWQDGVCSMAPQWQCTYPLKTGKCANTNDCPLSCGMCEQVVCNGSHECECKKIPGSCCDPAKDCNPPNACKEALCLDGVCQYMDKAGCCTSADICDANACQAAACIGNKCKITDKDVPPCCLTSNQCAVLSKNDPCISYKCQNNKCVLATKTPPPACCTSNDQCDDGNSCTTSVCNLNINKCTSQVCSKNAVCGQNSTCNPSGCKCEVCEAKVTGSKITEQHNKNGDELWVWPTIKSESHCSSMCYLKLLAKIDGAWVVCDDSPTSQVAANQYHQFELTTAYESIGDPGWACDIDDLDSGFLIEVWCIPAGGSKGKWVTDKQFPKP